MLIILREAFFKEDASIWVFRGKPRNHLIAPLLGNHLDKNYFIEGNTSINKHNSSSLY